MSKLKPLRIVGAILKSASILGLGLCCQTGGGVDFDSYKPDKEGKTDVSGILQEAINAAAKTDRTLILSPGRYWLAKPVVIQGNNLTISAKVPASAWTVCLQGYKTGPSRKALLAPDAPPRPEAIFKVKKPAHYLTLAGITFEHAVVGVEGDYALALFRAQNCAFYSCDYGIKADPLQIATISGCTFEAGKFGIRGRDGGQFLTPRPEQTTPRRNRSNLIHIYDCTFRCFSEYAVEIEGSPTNIRDCDFENCAGGAIKLLDLYVSTIAGSYFEGNSVNGNYLISVLPSSLPASHHGRLNIYGNQINLNGGDALIYVGKDFQLHAYDNRACVSPDHNQVLVKAESPGDHIKSENNIVKDTAAPEKWKQKIGEPKK